MWSWTCSHLRPGSRPRSRRQLRGPRSARSTTSPPPKPSWPRPTSTATTADARPPGVPRPWDRAREWAEGVKGVSGGSGVRGRGTVERHTGAVDYQYLLDEAMSAARRSAGVGRVADYIPALARADPDAFGIALATVDGELYGAGAWTQPFSVQSISKLFTLALVLADGEQGIWERVGREPSGNPFNSLVQLETERGIPRNPFINAGAIVVTDKLLSLTGDAAGAVRAFLRTEADNPLVRTDPEVAASEAGHGHRNAALAHFIASHGNLVNPVEEVLAEYYAHCAIEASCRDLALAGRFLARHGLRADGSRLLSRSDAKRVNGVLLTCGTYDRGGEFAYRVGLPGKSGVGGGVLAMIPGRAAVCAWSPGLDAAGNSVGAVAALDAFTTLSGLSVF
ncbi:glutaminase [Streptacidiphilus sp. 4-A2]|nr:glutaminase [Streptacidiphilus sp. 4-A2]